MSFDLDDELAKAIVHFEGRYGPRDPAFSIATVDYHALPYAQTRVDEIGGVIHVKLDAAAKGEDMRLKFQIWHEAVHCLAPVSTMQTTWFEEGLAVSSSLHASSIDRAYRRRCARDLKNYPVWHDPWRAFEKLNATDEQIREIHENAIRRQFHLVTPELIESVFDVPQALARQLCNRLPPTR